MGINMRGKMNIVKNITNLFDTCHVKLTPKRFYPILLGCFVVIGLLPLLMPGIPNGHDLYYHLSRLYAMDINIRAGEIPSMINHEALAGYGYATGLFYPDLFLYPAVILMKCGIGIITAYKCLVFVVIMAIVFSAYYCARKLNISYFGAFTSALLYTWSSYLAVDLFVRQAFGEFCSFIFMPWVILGIYEILLGNPRKFLYLSFGFTGLVCSHSLSLFMMTVICAVFFLLNIVRLLKSPQRIMYLALSPIPTILLGMAYLIPMFEQFSHLHFFIENEKNNDILTRCMPLLKLVLEIPTSKADVWIPSGIGLMLIIVALQRFRLRIRNQTPIMLFSDMLLIAGLCCLLMSTEMPSWKGAFKFMAVIQFPWRFFAPATAFLAFSGGVVLSNLIENNYENERHWVWLVICGSAFAWFVNVGYFYAARISEHDITHGYVPGKRQEASGIHYLIRDGLLDDAIRLRRDIFTSTHPIDGILSRPQANILQLDFLHNSNDNLIELPILPYYGYAAQIKLPDKTEHQLNVGVGTNKLLTVHIPHDYSSGTIRIFYCATPLQRLSQLVSLASAIGFLVLLLLKRRLRWIKKGN